MSYVSVFLSQSTVPLSVPRVMNFVWIPYKLRTCGATAISQSRRIWHFAVRLQPASAVASSHHTGEISDTYTTHTHTHRGRRERWKLAARDGGCSSSRHDYSFAPVLPVSSSGGGDGWLAVCAQSEGGRVFLGCVDRSSFSGTFILCTDVQHSSKHQQ